jgi:integrase
MDRINEGVSANTMNHEHDYLRGVFNELKRLGYWTKENPLGNLRRFKIAENELKWLSDDEIKLLLKTLETARNPHVKLITKVSLSTGGRWGEIEQMNISQVGAGLIQFTKTKSGRTRAIPISIELENELREHHKKHGVLHRIFKNAYPAFTKNIERAGIELPKGQSAHVLRHTFASHFMKNGGNILALQRALGHSDLKMTMRYAHLAPEHLQEVVNMNPLARLTLG